MRAPWQIADQGARLRLELVDFPTGDREACGVAEREVDGLLWRRFEPDVRRLLDDVYDALNGIPPRQGGDFSPGPDFEQTLASDLRFAAYSGRLRVERSEPVYSVPVSPESDEAPPLGPAPVIDAWIAIELVDDKGKPVPGAAYLIKCDNGWTRTGTTNGDGKAREDGLVPGSCKVSFPGLNGPDWKQM